MEPQFPRRQCIPTFDNHGIWINKAMLVWVNCLILYSFQKIEKHEIKLDNAEMWKTGDR